MTRAKKENEKKENELYRARLNRDARYDGKFFVGVKSTGIYCRPICPAKQAKRSNLQFFMRSADAESSGFRACLRCRPEATMGSPAWRGKKATVDRATRLMKNQIADIALDNSTKKPSIGLIASRLGISDRWLRELFKKQLGAKPSEMIAERRVLLACELLLGREFSITEIAFRSGFGSIRRFNDEFKSRIAMTPTAFRKHGAKNE